MLERIINSHWDFFRWLRLVMGILFIASGLVSHDYMAPMFGVLFATQAILNIGCCSPGVCYPASKTDKKEPSSEVIFEEIKTK